MWAGGRSGEGEDWDGGASDKAASLAFHSRSARRDDPSVFLCDVFATLRLKDDDRGGDERGTGAAPLRPDAGGMGCTLECVVRGCSGVADSEICVSGASAMGSGPGESLGDRRRRAGWLMVVVRVWLSSGASAASPLSLGESTSRASSAELPPSGWLAAWPVGVADFSFDRKESLRTMPSPRFGGVNAEDTDSLSAL